MIPSLLAQDVAKSLREFIVTGFETDTLHKQMKYPLPASLSP